MPRMQMLIAMVLVCNQAYAIQPCPESATTGIPGVELREVATGLSQPVHVAPAPGIRGHLYVVEQQGRIRIVSNGKLVTEPFLDLTSKVDSGGEKGLLSIAFHPDFQKNREFFVNYTAKDRKGLHTRISRLRANSEDRADHSSETVLMRISQPFSNHNGGQIAFGPDGYLYIGMGDGGSANDPLRKAQDPTSHLGKVLRIDVNRREHGMGYSIPKSNPFVGRPGYQPEIWALGLRNPWRFSFDASNGTLWLADVGQDQVEEINVIHKAGNYGWPEFEGDRCNTEVASSCDTSGRDPPVFTYRHPEGFSITGGFVYRGSTIAGLCGAYVFADYVTQKVWAIRVRDGRVVAHAELLSRRGAVSTFGQDDRFELFVVDHRSGKLFQLVEK